MKNSKSKIISSLGLMGAGAAIWQVGYMSAPAGKPAFAAADLTPAPATAPLVATAPMPTDINVFSNLAKKAVPSVVNISTLARPAARSQRIGPEDLFRQFFGGGGMPGDPYAQSYRGRGSRAPQTEELAPRPLALGTGFVIDASGIILTNNHVVDGADEIKVQFTEDPNEKPTDGKVIGRDPDLDVALIKVKTSRKLTPLALGDSEAMQVGEYVMAVGNPFGQGHSVSHGIISGTGRLAPGLPLANYLQTDAPINPGNSGGPLLNLRGEVIGINNAIDARAQGIGFAIPINFVKKVLAQLESTGKVSRGYIGAVVGSLNPELAMRIGVDKDLEAPFVTDVAPGSPAFKAGIRPYDAILEFNGTAVRSPQELVNAVVSIPAGKTVPVKISRAGKLQTLDLKVEPRPDTQHVASREE